MCSLTDPKGNIYIFVSHPLTGNRGIDTKLVPSKVEILRDMKPFFDLSLPPNAIYKEIIRLPYREKKSTSRSLGEIFSQEIQTPLQGLNIHLDFRPRLVKILQLFSQHPATPNDHLQG